MRMYHFLVQNGLFVQKKFFLVQTIIISFVYILALFTVQNLKQFLQWILGYEGAPFLGPNSPFAPIFFWKINIIPIYLSAPFIEQNVKKILLMVPELWGRTIFGPNMAHFTKWEFFQKTCCWALFFFSFMSIYMPKIKVRYWSISQILTITEYWNLIGREAFLANLWTRLSPGMQFSQNVNKPEELSFYPNSRQT